MRLKGHKPGCRCVGCDPATRRRGMSALKHGGYRRKKRTALSRYMEKWDVPQNTSSAQGKRKNPWARVKYKARTAKLWRVKSSGRWGIKSKKKNPFRNVRHERCSPHETTIYAKFLPFKIYAVKGASSMYAGERFQHTFRAGGRVTGLPDGSIRLYPAKGKRLWSMIAQRR